MEGALSDFKIEFREQELPSKLPELPLKVPQDLPPTAQVMPPGADASENDADEDNYEQLMKPVKRYQSFLQQHHLTDDLRSSVLYQVHEDLRLIRKWTKLRVVKGLSRSYLAGWAAAGYDSVFPGRAGEDNLDRTQVVVPMPTTDYLSPRRLKALCRQCVHPETGQNLRCVTVAIVDSDSTTAYYRVFDTWEEIVHPQWKQKKLRPKHDDGANGTEEREGNKAADDDSSLQSDGSDSDSD